MITYPLEVIYDGTLEWSVVFLGYLTMLYENIVMDVVGTDILFTLSSCAGIDFIPLIVDKGCRKMGTSLTISHEDVKHFCHGCLIDKEAETGIQERKVVTRYPRIPSSEMRREFTEGKSDNQMFRTKITDNFRKRNEFH